MGDIRVYCKDCKHSKDKHSLCRLMYDNAVYNEYTGQCAGFKINTDNSKGDCRYFQEKKINKRIWYKFWVKEGENE